MMKNNEPAPADFRWPNGGKLALSIVVNVEEGAEKRVDEGDRGPEPVDELKAVPRKPIRVYSNESNYEYGINRGAPRVLKILDKAGVNATWTVCGQALEKAPWLADAIMKRGDEPADHGHKWAFTAFMEKDAEAAFIEKSASSIEKTCGRRPAGWLSRYLYSANTRGLLKDAGYLYHMDDYSDDFPYWDEVEVANGSKEPIVILPYAIDSNDMKFWIDPSFMPDMWLDYAKRTFNWLYNEAQEEGARMMSLGLHLRIIGRPGRIEVFQQFLEHVRNHSDVWVATREQIAGHFAANVPARK